MTSEATADIEQLHGQIAALRAALAWALPFVYDEWTGTDGWISGEFGRKYRESRALLNDDQRKGVPAGPEPPPA